MGKAIHIFEENIMFLDRIGRRKSYSKLFPDASMLAEKNQDTMLKIEKRILEILEDERLGYKTATIFENAPLALVQLQMETELHTLQRVLGLKPTNIKELRKETK